MLSARTNSITETHPFKYTQVFTQISTSSPKFRSLCEEQDSDEGENVRRGVSWEGDRVREDDIATHV